MVSAPKEVQDILENEEDKQGDFVAVPDGMYLCEIVKAEEYEPAANREYGGMNTRWKIVQPRQYAGKDEDGNTWGDLWLRLSWSPKAAWKIREFWDALGYEYDSDFDEPVEEKEQAILVVETKPQAQGKRKGQLQANVMEILEATPEAVAEIEA